jgi:hypothetical protein
MKDVSASGYRLHAPINDAMDLTLNTLVAIHRHGGDGWVMGIVRRMRRLSTRDAEIGLQLIATTLAGAELTEQRKARGADYPVTGAHSAVAGRQFRGLFLSFKRRPEEPPVQSLIVPAVEFHASGLYTLRTGPSLRTIRYGRLLEQHADWVWTVIDPVSSDSDAAGVGDLSAAGWPADRYREIVAAHRWNVPAEFNIGQACCARWANDRLPLCVVLGGRGRHEPRVHVLGSAAAGKPPVQRARGHGVGRGDKIARYFRNGRETVVAHVATYQLGAVSVPLSFLFGTEALEYRLNDSDARIAFVDPQSAAESRTHTRPMSRHHPCRRRRRVGRDRDHALRGAARAGIVTLRPRRDALRGSGAPRLHERHDWAAEGRPDAAPVSPRQSAGIRPFARWLSARRRSLLVVPTGLTGGLHGRAPSRAAFRSADRRLSGAVRPERACADGEVRVRNSFLP